MRKLLAILLSTTILVFCALATTVAQEKQMPPEKTENEKLQDSDKPDVALKIKSKPRVNLDMRCREKVAGTVRLRVTFHESKKVTDVSIVQKSSCSYFDQDAIKAAKRVKFEPAVKNGQPITVTKMLEYNFQIY